MEAAWSRSKPCVLIPLAHYRAAYGAVLSLGRAGYRVAAAFPPLSYRRPVMYSRFISETLRCPDPKKSLEDFQNWLQERMLSHPEEVVLPVNEAVVASAAALRLGSMPGHRFILPRDSHLRHTLSKYVATRAAQAAGIATPQTAFLRAEGEDRISHDVDDLSYPFLLKWDNHQAEHGGYVQGGTAFVSDEPTFLDLIAELEPSRCAVLAQKIVPGQGVGAFFLRNGGKTILRFAHSRLHEVPWTGGVSSLSESSADPEVLAAGKHLLDSIGYEGVAMVEFRKEPGKPPVFLEINGRLWGSIGLALRAGIDFPLAMIETHLNGRTSVASPESWPAIKCRNLPLDFEHLHSVFRSDLRQKPGAPNRLRAVADFALNSVDPRTKSDVFWGDDPRVGAAAVWRMAISPARALKSTLTSLPEILRIARLRRRLATQSREWPAINRIHSTGRILFLCYGNICRSPYAAARWNEMRDGQSYLPEASSAGFHPQSLRPTPARFQAAALRRGIDLSCHRSQTFAKEMLQEAELVVVMDMRNADSLLRLFPESERKTILLNALVCQGEPEIADPYGKPLPAGAVAYSQIDTALVALAKNLTLSSTPAGLTESCA